MSHAMFARTCCAFFLTGTILGGGAYATVSPLLDEDFQADTVGQRPVATGTQFTVACQPTGGNTSTSKILVTDGSPDDVYDPFRRIGNRSIRFDAATVSDTPSFFITNQLTSGVTYTHDGEFSVRTFIVEPTSSSSAAILKVSFGRDANNNSQLDATEQVAQIDVLADGSLLIRSGSGSFVSDQTYSFDEIHDLSIRFTAGTSGTFAVTLDDQVVTSGGNSAFTAQSSTNNVDSAFVMAQGAASSQTTAYVDNVFLIDGHGVTYYVALNGNDGYNGLTPAYPLLTPRVAVNRAKPGDTIKFASGLYRLADALGNINTSATPSTRITLRGEPDHSSILTTMEDRSDPNQWTEVSGYPHVYEHMGVGEMPWDGSTVPLFRHATQDGNVLRFVAPNESSYGSPADLTGPGQWTRDYATGKIYIWAYGNGNPGSYQTEISRRYSTLYIKPSGTSGGADYVTVRDLNLQGSYYTVNAGGHYAEILHCVISNACADLIKADGFSTHTLIEGNEFYHMGESAVDNCLCDYWTIRGNVVHDGWSNRLYGTKVNGFMLKMGVKYLVVEENQLTNLDTRFGAIGIGGASSNNPAIEAQYLTVRNNFITYCTGPYAVAFLSARDCVFTDNIVFRFRGYHYSDYDLVTGLIVWASNDGTNNTHPCQNNTLTNNILEVAGAPSVSKYTYMEYQPGNRSGTISGNVVTASRKHYVYDAYGVGQEVTTGFFPDDLDPQ